MNSTHEDKYTPEYREYLNTGGIPVASRRQLGHSMERWNYCPIDIVTFADSRYVVIVGNWPILDSIWRLGDEGVKDGYWNAWKSILRSSADGVGAGDRLHGMAYATTQITKCVYRDTPLSFRQEGFNKILIRGILIEIDTSKFTAGEVATKLENFAKSMYEVLKNRD